MADKQALLELIDRLADRRLLVVGDLVLDEYLVGAPGRISREAPVMVLEFTERFVRPGSASNPAANLAALGARTCLLGVAGQDENGRALLDQLLEAGIDCSGVVVASSRPTTTKTRILAEDPMGRRQQLLRLDRVPPDHLDPALVQAVVDAIVRRAAEADALVLSDYKGGVLCAETIAAARSAGKPVLVDSQGDLWRFRGCTLVKANQADAQAATGRRLDSLAALEQAGQELARELEADYVVITRGAEGLSAFGARGRHVHVPGVPTEVFDVTGAGDTVIAVLGAALAAGANIDAAASLANYAASVVVRKLGAAAITPEELRETVEQFEI